ncbi:DUF6174 domain-containing protein [Deinococcus radiotolerans]|uniref:Uncharacterized protein n=1 Tax=Deinococcus radiotolerans TaxID=1309407 RepID=A0ABQ2FL35_9DEIO|nr:DUF6174 domain-containing protein [Deinococcus radiotolerans]GGL04805.1 hypothetical protein GCM10010844_24410 [Deinococcus radiotolerans]
MTRTRAHRPLRPLLTGLLAAALGSAALAGGGQTPPTGAPTTAPFGCRAGYVRPDFAALNAQLNRARTLWAAQHPASYTYDVDQIAAPVLFPGTRVTVQAGRVTGTALAPGQEGTVNPTLAGRTVDARFTDMAATLNAQAKAPCPLVEQSFDPQLGYPTRFASGLGDAGIADGFGEWRITNFTRTN